METVVFSDDEIRQRFIDMHHIIAGFCNAHAARTGRRLSIDTQLLYLVVVAISDDVARYKAYHLPDPDKQRANSIKRAAYGAKWIVRFNPIIVVDDLASDNRGLPAHDGLVNAKLAVFYALINLEEIVEDTLAIGKINLSIDNEILLDIMYDIVYRGIGGESLMLVLEILWRSATNQKISSVK